MKRQRKTKAGAGIVILLAMLLCMPLLALAGSLEPSAAPTVGTMHSLEDIYNIVKAFNKTPAEVCAGVKFMGLREDGTIGEQTGTKDCTPPTTTTTLVVTQTTTTTSVSAQRFTDNGNGTVKDNLTGLVWLKNANPCGTKNWYDAGTYCASLANGQAGLTDGSTAGQWRLPSKEEFEGIGTDPPATWESAYPSVTWTMPGAPFTGVQPDVYWSGTSYNTDLAWFVDVSYGYVHYDYGRSKSRSSVYVWPVRSGN